MFKGMAKPLLLVVIGVIVLFGLIFAYKAYVGYIGGKMMAANQSPVFTVSTVKVEYKQWPQQLKATGSFSAVLGTNVTSEIAGLVRKVYFNNGDTVKKNDLLVELNPDTEIATLQVYQAQTQLAQITYERDLAQYAVHAVSKQQVDNDLANWKVGQSQIAEEQSIIAKKMIRAPFDGRLGISPLKPGDYVSPGNKIVSLQALDPIYVEFTLPQQNLPLVQVGQTITLTTNVFPQQIFSGKINAIEPVVEVSTRNVAIEAILNNPQKTLLPGIFADVTVTFGAPQKILTVPISAVAFNPYGQIAYLVKDSGKKNSQGQPALTVMQTFVKTGEARGDQIQILSGINPGDVVVTSGQLKLKNGSPVVVNNQIKPSDNPNPQVSNEHI
jgi:membrane fusion protein, multidrug efflux system